MIRPVLRTLRSPILWRALNMAAARQKIMRRADGSLWIHRFAHGRTTYELKFDAKTIDMILENTADADVMGVFIRLALDGDIASHELGGFGMHSARACASTNGPLIKL